MAFHSFTGTTCPVNPESPVFFTLADGIRRFEERAGNLAWSIEQPEEGRIIGWAPALPAEPAGPWRAEAWTCHAPTPEGEGSERFDIFDLASAAVISHDQLPNTEALRLDWAVVE